MTEVIGNLLLERERKARCRRELTACRFVVFGEENFLGKEVFLRGGNVGIVGGVCFLCGEASGRGGNVV